jgi:multidrug efflux pump subunit AcrA (membrane-fusion protein)
LSNRITHFISFLLIAFLVSCNKQEIKPPSTFTVESTSFEDAIELEGHVLPVEVNTIVTPGFVDGVVLSIVEDGTYVNAGDTVCVLEDKNLKDSYDRNKADLDNSVAELNKVKADLNMQYSLLEAQVKSNEAETEIANLDSTSLKFSTLIQSKIKRLELEKVSIEKNKLQKKLKAMAVINQSEVKKLEMRNKTLQMRVEMAEKQMKDLKLVTPKAGLATRAIHQVTSKKVLPTDPVWGQMPLVIIPELTKMKVTIIATEGQFKRIDENDSVSYSFDAMPGNKAWGKITKKAPVGQPIKENSKVKMFEVEASVDKSLSIPPPDLSCRCKIIIKHTDHVMVIPQVAIFEEEGKKYVYVQKAKTFEKRQIKIGESSMEEAVITAGLSRKEKVALTQPASELINGQKLLTRPQTKKLKKNIIHHKND